MTRLVWRYARRAVSRRTGHLPGAVRGLLWAMAAATLFMATFVTAFALFTDALRDALDPKLR